MHATPAIPPSTDTRFFGHPRGLAVLFFAELWERFSYYGMRAFLVLFMTASVDDGGLSFDVPVATAIYALYTSLVYLLSLPGGWLADRIFGQRRAVLYGGMLIAAGHFTLAWPSVPAFYAGLLLIVCGTGLLKPNISVIVGQLYGAEDVRRDSAFSIFYMGINVGAFSGPLLCSFLAEKINWHIGFSAAGFGMLLGLAVYVWGGRFLGEAGRRTVDADDPQAAAGARRTLWRALSASIGAALVFLLLQAGGIVDFSVAALADWFGVILLGITVVFFAWLFLAGNWTPAERNRLWAIVVLFLAASFFWGAYEQAGSSLTLFARDHTERLIAGWEFPVGWFQPVPALFCVLLAPIYAWVWVRMGRRQPSSPAKFALGVAFVGIGTLVMVAASMLSASGVKVGVGWLLMTYFLHVVGEMFLSPVGLSTVSKLAPQRVTSLMMGVWFLASAVGNYIAGRVAGFYASMELTTLFLIIALVPIGFAVVLALLIKPIRRLMGGVH